MLELTINELSQPELAKFVHRRPKPVIEKLQFILDDFRELQTESYKTYLHDNTCGVRIIGLLGSSLGNFREDRILEVIKSVMRPGDYLLIGIEYVSSDDPATNYSDKEVVKFECGPVTDLFGWLPREARESIEDGGRLPNNVKDMEYEVVESTRSEKYSIIPDSATIVGYANNLPESVRPLKTHLQLFWSTKYNPESFVSYMTAEGFIKVGGPWESPEPVKCSLCREEVRLARMKTPKMASWEVQDPNNDRLVFACSQHKLKFESRPDCKVRAIPTPRYGKYLFRIGIGDSQHSTISDKVREMVSQPQGRKKRFFPGIFRRSAASSSEASRPATGSVSMQGQTIRLRTQRQSSQSGETISHPIPSSNHELPCVSSSVQSAKTTHKHNVCNAQKPESLANTSRSSRAALAPHVENSKQE